MEHSKSGPYYVSLEKYGNEPIDIFSCDYNSNTDVAKNEEHSICFYRRSGTEHGLFISKLYAKTEADALSKAIKIRDEAITSGGWELAWNTHIALSNLLNEKS